ncbi:unnamed protein product, partial [Protopolystoma xenopodis]
MSNVNITCPSNNYSPPLSNAVSLRYHQLRISSLRSILTWHHHVLSSIRVFAPHLHFVSLGTWLQLLLAEPYERRLFIIPLQLAPWHLVLNLNIHTTSLHL